MSVSIAGVAISLSIGEILAIFYNLGLAQKPPGGAAPQPSIIHDLFALRHSAFSLHFEGVSLEWDFNFDRISSHVLISISFLISDLFKIIIKTYLYWISESFIGDVSAPNRTRTWLILSNRRVSFPCSISRTKRSPTPDFWDSSTYASPNSFRLAFIYFAKLISYYTLKGIKYWNQSYFIFERV